MTKVTVRENDTLWGLAEKHLGDGKRWSELWKLNSEVIVDGQLKFLHSPLSGPDLLFPGMELEVPDDVSS